MTGGPDAGYSEIADAQLDQLERQVPISIFEAVVATCEWILDEPGAARSRSAAISTMDGIRFRLAVPGTDGLKVFWSSEGPRIEAVFGYPT